MKFNDPSRNTSCQRTDWLPQILAVLLAAIPLTSVRAEDLSAAEQLARQVLTSTGVAGGLVVHLGCGDGRLTAALRANDSYIVQGLDADPANVERARQHIRSLGVYGKVSVDHLRGQRLPYIDNFANLIVVEDPAIVTPAEIMRALCPGGVVYAKRNGEWIKTVKPRPSTIDEWTHYMHDASNNAVAHDEVVAPPRRLQWVGGPRYSRHHDRMSSVSAVVSAGGRMFYIFDEASRVSVLLPPRWSLIARDAFNGAVLWKRKIDKWHPHLWPLKSGPAQLPRRLVAVGDRVYVTLDLESPLIALDAATGKTVRSYPGTRGTQEIILSGGILFLFVDENAKEVEYDVKKRRRSENWEEKPKKLMAVRAETGEVLWESQRTMLPVTLAADDKHVVFHDGGGVVSLDRDSGEELWRSKPVPRSEEIRPFYAPTLVLYQDVVLFSGGETAGVQKGWYTSGKDTLTALSAETGKELWSAYHPPSGYRSPEDVLVANGLVWTGETTSGRAVGKFTGRDPHTGEVKVEFPPDVDTYWFHHRCYRGKATDNFLIMSRTGTEFIDVRNKSWDVNHWVRGACSYGVMPANGLIYAPQHPCACYMEAKLNGLNALAPASDGPRIPADLNSAERLEKGPAYNQSVSAKPSAEEWPTYRHDALRSGRASTSVPAMLGNAWQTELGGKLTSPVAAGQQVFVAAVDAHTVHALDAESGRQLWSYTVGGRVDSPPTIYNGKVLFGSTDGWVYCLRADDGSLVWRFRAAPMDQRLMSFEQIESVWPVHGNVLIQDDVLFCVAGRSMFLDNGMRLWRLDPVTGRVLSETVLNERDPRSDSGKDIQDYVSWLNMPPALPDILSSDGKLVYMRSQPFQLDGTRLPLEAFPREADADQGAPPATQRRDHAHLFSPTGFLEDSWWHRSYWLYGSRYISGWQGYYRAGKATPAGRMLVFDESRVYGFARKPKYYRWTTKIEHQLFCADKMPPESSQADYVSPKEKRRSASKTKGSANDEFAVTHHWISDVPLFARAMVLTGKTLFIAGPADLIDEEQVYGKLDDPETQSELARQALALEGKSGGRLWAVSIDDGGKLSEYQLPAPPVFDGMVAANQRLYLSTTDGSVMCMKGKE